MGPFEEWYRKMAQRRLAQRLNQEETFGVPMQPTAQDLIDYETASGGVPWPKEKVTLADMQRMQADMAGNGDVRPMFDVPQETIARPLSGMQIKLRDALQKSRANEMSKAVAQADFPNQLQQKFSQLRNFLPKSIQDTDIKSFVAGMGKPSTAETWGNPYTGPNGSLLQRSSTGKVASVLGRDTSGAKDENQRVALERHFRNDALRLYGASEFSALDPSTRDRVNEVATRASKNFIGNPRGNYNQALTEAYNYTEGKYAKLATLPRPQRSMWGGKIENYAEAADKVAAAVKGGVPANDVVKKLAALGWTKDEVQEVIRTMPEAAGAPAPTAAATAQVGNMQAPGGGTQSQDPFGIGLR